MKPSYFLLLFCLGSLSQTASCPVTRAATPPHFSSASDQSGQNANSSVAEHQVTIPGPLRSFLRMSGISQEVSSEEVLPILAHNVILHGYELGRSTEYLILLRRYVQQAKELTTLAGQPASLRVQGCKDSDALLRVLGYRTEGECGHDGMSLVTADPEKAFLTIDSGFPLLQLEGALQHDAPFTYPYQGSNVPALFTPAEWVAVTQRKEIRSGTFWKASCMNHSWRGCTGRCRESNRRRDSPCKDKSGWKNCFPLLPRSISTEASSAFVMVPSWSPGEKRRKRIGNSWRVRVHARRRTSFSGS